VAEERFVSMMIQVLDEGWARAKDKANAPRPALARRDDRASGKAYPSAGYHCQNNIYLIAGCAFYKVIMNIIQYENCL
jgi:hypothetical protein